MQKKIRRKRQILRNRTVILRSARELFHKKGFYGTTMEDIAQFSGFDRRTIYNHFKNKEDVFAALISGILTDIDLIFNDIAEEKGSSLDRLRELVLRLLDLYIENSQLLNIFMSEYETNEIKKKRHLSAYTLKNISSYKKIESRLVAMIKAAQDDDHAGRPADLRAESVLEQLRDGHHPRVAKRLDAEARQPDHQHRHRHRNARHLCPFTDAGSTCRSGGGCNRRQWTAGAGCGLLS